MSNTAFLSATEPAGLNEAGLPIGVQPVDPEYADLITIGVARALEADGCEFVPPPGSL